MVTKKINNRPKPGPDPFNRVKKIIGDLDLDKIEAAGYRTGGVTGSLSYLKDAQRSLKHARKSDRFIADQVYDAKNKLSRTKFLIRKNKRILKHADSLILIIPSSLLRLFRKLEKSGLGHLSSKGKRFVWSQNLTDLAFLFHYLVDKRPNTVQILSKTDFSAIVGAFFILPSGYKPAAIEKTWSSPNGMPGGNGYPYGVKNLKKCAIRERIAKVVDQF